jgi:hypothetical protein
LRDPVLGSEDSRRAAREDWSGTGEVTRLADKPALGNVRRRDTRAMSELPIVAPQLAKREFSLYRRGQ